MILRDDPIEALKILPKGNKLRKKLIKKLDHMRNPKAYEKKYAEDEMNWKPTILQKDYHTWILQEAEGAKSLIDLGCYEGSLVARALEKGIKAKGVEMCKAAVKHAKTLSKGEFVEGDASNYQDGNKYDAVCACELIEHVPSSIKLIKNMLSLVSDTGWCYISTPNGPFDLEATKTIASSGFVTTIKMQFGECFTTFSVTSLSRSLISFRPLIFRPCGMKITLSKPPGFSGMTTSEKSTFSRKYFR